MLKKYIKITNEEYGESYIETLENLMGALDGELDGIETAEVGWKLTLEIIEMKEADFNKLPEFTGW